MSGWTEVRTDCTRIKVGTLLSVVDPNLVNANVQMGLKVSQDPPATESKASRTRVSCVRGSATRRPARWHGAPVRHNLVPVIEGLKGPNDQTGHRGWNEGYVVSGAYVGKYLRGGLKYRVTLSGKATDGAAASFVARCRNAANEMKEFASWGAGFTDKWTEAALVEADIPAEVNHLERVYLYRYNNKGAIWYGQPVFCLADILAEGLDVTGQLSGQPLRLASGSIMKITYTDENSPSQAPRVRVRLAREQP